MPQSIAELVSIFSKYSFGMAEALLRDIPAGSFARLATPGGVKIESNHPAFCYGHLALYPARLADTMGVSVPAIVTPAGWSDLFSAGKPCLDDPQGTIYPPMEVLTKAFFDNYRGVLAAIASADPGVFDKPHPNEKVRERFPTVGSLAVFLFTSHIMMHMGQVSAWRRMMGMGSVQM